MRRIIALLGLVMASIVAGTGATTPASATVSAPGAVRQYLVVYQKGAATSARASIKAAGGTIVKERSIGVATVTTRNALFQKALVGKKGIVGAARDGVIGSSRQPSAATKRDAVEKEGRTDPVINSQPPSHSNSTTSHPFEEPFADRQWDMRMIGATPTGSYSVQQGSKQVLVGVIDTGVDGNHPDIKPNFDFAKSRNFTTDIPLIDGECADEADGSCSDPAWVDEDGHGTHVASTIASPINDLGIAGVAPNVTLVNVRAGQDSGYFFLQPSVDALMYAGDIGIDVVNMSFYIDPWLYNCPAGAPAMTWVDPADPSKGMKEADTPEEQAEQQAIITGTQRALQYAWDHGVTLVGAAGNSHIDLGADPKVDETSPDFPPGTEHHRIVSNACLDLPTEGVHVISVTSVGPSGRKADYSNYGLEQAAVAAPGGWFRDGLGTKYFRSPENMILAAYPKNVARANGEITKGGGVPNNPFVLRDCAKAGGPCAYYQYIQGTSMAAPHATGVVALIVSKFGTADAVNGGLTMSPAAAEARLYDSAVAHACPPGGVQSYTDVGRDESFTATCEGTTEFNGFYGHGIVNALNAVS